MKMIRSNCTSACKFCQIKKIKCDHQKPCMNCIKRNIKCELSDKKKSRGPKARIVDKSKISYILN